MFDRIDLLKTAGQLAELANRRHAVTAQNVANADTPGYRAQDVRSFGEIYRGGSSLELLQTRSTHRKAATSEALAQILDTNAAADPNGNTVTLETEMVRSAQAKREHDMAVTIYQTTLGLVRTALGRGR